MLATIRKPDGTLIEVEARETLLPWQKMGLQYTASGYGGKIPTRHMVKVDNRWRRVYVAQWSNIGTAYIERDGAWWVVEHIN